MKLNFTKKTFLVLIVILVTLAYWELGLRMIGKTAFPLLRTDPQVGSIHVKNFSGDAWDVLASKTSYIHTNSIGYIGDDVTLEKPTSTVRIALLGDSSLAALQVNYYDNFTHLLEDALNTANPCGSTHFEVMNFGVGSAGTFSEYQTYKIKVAPFHPDYVIVLFADDYGDNNMLSSFELEHYAENRKSVGIKSFLLNFELPKFIYRKLIGNPFFTSMLHRAGILEGSSVPETVTEIPATSTSTATSVQFYEFTFDIFLKFKHIVEQDGSAFRVVIMPNETLDYTHKGDWQSDAHVVKLMDFLSSQQIPVYNPSDLLAEAKSHAPGCLTVDCADHFTLRGHQVMAKALYMYVKNDLLRAGVNCPK